jgi:hypothetical protein
MISAWTSFYYQIFDGAKALNIPSIDQEIIPHLHYVTGI